MLLQLVEPGQTPLPHTNDKSVAIGIDLGTTNSLAAFVKNDQPFIIHLNDELGVIPSAVYYGPSSEVVVGNDALKKLEIDPANVITSVKRFMGQRAEDASHPIHLFSTSHGPKNPIEISAEILKLLRKNAETALNQKVTQAVITVPAYFDDTARTATRDAARLADLRCCVF